MRDFKNYKHNKTLVPTARMLRKNMTKEEKHLWYDYLKDYPVRFLKQKILGVCVVDFYCAKAKLVIEIDGAGHFTPDGVEHDIERNEYLEQYGISVIHISNYDINCNFTSVCEYIDNMVKKHIYSQ